MKDAEIIAQYVQLAPFLAQALGHGCEVVVHDLTRTGHELAAIHNAHTPRAVGDPMGAPARQLLACWDRQAEPNCPAIAHRTAQGEILSSVYPIQNGDRTIGLLCLNKSLTPTQELSLALHKLLSQFNLTPPESAPIQDGDDVTAWIRGRIAEEVAACGALPARLSMEEKVRIVHHLNDAGILRMKGAVPEIARQLSVSVPTVYRYLNKPISE